MCYHNLHPLAIPFSRHLRTHHLKCFSVKGSIGVQSWVIEKSLNTVEIERLLAFYCTGQDMMQDKIGWTYFSREVEQRPSLRGDIDALIVRSTRSHMIVILATIRLSYSMLMIRQHSQKVEFEIFRLTHWILICVSRVIVFQPCRSKGILSYLVSTKAAIPFPVRSLISLTLKVIR